MKTIIVLCLLFAVCSQFTAATMFCATDAQCAFKNKCCRPLCPLLPCGVCKDMGSVVGEKCGTTIYDCGCVAPLVCSPSVNAFGVAQTTCQVAATTTTTTSTTTSATTSTASTTTTTVATTVASSG